MAIVAIRGSETVLKKDEAAVYLSDQGFIYESWGVGRLRDSLKDSYTLSEGEQQEILALYGKEISALKASQGYLTEDIVVLSSVTENLEGILEKFKREHHHTDDEVRFVVDGSGIFTFRKGSLIFDVTVHPGDLLSVPAYTRHWFDLCEEKKIKCIRIFKDPAGWVAIYDEPTLSSVS